MRKKAYVIYLLVFILAFGCKEVTKKDVSETPILNTVDNAKVHIEQNTKCINFLASQNPDIYPLTEKKLDTDKMYDLLTKIDYSFANTPDKIKALMCDGGLNCDINCEGEVKYNLVSYYCDGEKHFVNLAIIKGDKVDIKKLHGTYVHDFKNIDKYSFVLDHDNLEITKTNHANTDNYEEKEVSREVTKYKLTDQGLVEL